MSDKDSASDSPDKLALVPVIGVLLDSQMYKGAGWSGILTATVSLPAVMVSGTQSDFLNIIVSAPGQNVFCRLNPRSRSPFISGTH